MHLDQSVSEMAFLTSDRSGWVAGAHVATCNPASCESDWLKIQLLFYWTGFATKELYHSSVIQLQFINRAIWPMLHFLRIGLTEGAEPSKVTLSQQGGILLGKMDSLAT